VAIFISHNFKLMLELNFDPFPFLETERLSLRKVSMDDAEEMFLLRTNEKIMKYIHRPRPESVDDARELIKKMNEPDRIQWGIAIKGNNKLIGTIGYNRIEKVNFRAEIGYMLHDGHWNQGLTSEAIRKVIDYGFNEMKLHSIEAIIDPDNDISRQTVKKFNFIQEGYFKEKFFFDGKFWDFEVYSLLNNENKW
jgi:ribosomal-protein-alanine N-acetyltransferase